MKKDMHPETLKCLRTSIKKWRMIEAGEEMPNPKGRFSVSDVSTCALCHRFTCFLKAELVPRAPVSEQCPVAAAASGSDVRCNSCAQTPYSDWADCHATNTAQEAQAEVDFLISLLPEGEPEEGETYEIQDLVNAYYA